MKKIIISIVIILSTLGPVKEAQAIFEWGLLLNTGVGASAAAGLAKIGGKIVEKVNGVMDLGFLIVEKKVSNMIKEMDSQPEARKTLFQKSLPAELDSDYRLFFTEINQHLTHDPRTLGYTRTFDGVEERKTPGFEAEVQEKKSSISPPEGRSVFCEYTTEDSIFTLEIFRDTAFYKKTFDESYKQAIQVRKQALLQDRENHDAKNPVDHDIRQIKKQLDYLLSDAEKKIQQFAQYLLKKAPKMIKADNLIYYADDSSTYLLVNKIAIFRVESSALKKFMEADRTEASSDAFSSPRHRRSALNSGELSHEATHAVHPPSPQRLQYTVNANLGTIDDHTLSAEDSTEPPALIPAQADEDGDIFYSVRGNPGQEFELEEVTHHAATQRPSHTRRRQKVPDDH